MVLCPAVVHSEAAEGVSAEPSFLEDGNNASSLATQLVIVPLRTISPDMATADTHAVGTYVVSTGAEQLALAMPEPGLNLIRKDQESNSQQSQGARPVSVDSQHSGGASGETAASQAAANSAAGSVLISSAAKASSDAQLSAPTRVGSMSRVSSGHRSVSSASDAAIETADDGQAEKDDSVHDNVIQSSADSQTSSRRSSGQGVQSLMSLLPLLESAMHLHPMWEGLQQSLQLALQHWPAQQGSQARALQLGSLKTMGLAVQSQAEAQQQQAAVAME